MIVIRFLILILFLAQNYSALQAQTTDNFLDAKGKTNKSDSLLKLMENASNTDKTLYKIEFWKSPINYRGFKMIRNNIIAFGLEINELVKLFSYEQQIYLKQGNSVYKLNQTTDFQPFYKVNEEAIIKLMR